MVKYKSQLHLTIAVLNGRIIFFYEYSLHELHSLNKMEQNTFKHSEFIGSTNYRNQASTNQGTFADTTTAQNDQLVFSHFATVILTLSPKHRQEFNSLH